MAIRVVRDAQGNAIPIVGLYDPRTVQVGSTSTTATGGPSSSIVQISCDVGVKYQFGIGTVATNEGHLLPAGVVQYLEVATGYNVAIRTVTGTATGVLGVFCMSSVI